MLTPAQRQEFEAAKTRGFVYLAADGADFALDNAFFQRGRLKNRPIVSGGV